MKVLTGGIEDVVRHENTNKAETGSKTTSLGKSVLKWKTIYTPQSRSNGPAEMQQQYSILGLILFLQS